MGVLTVKLVKATNLADEDYAGKTDAYVIMELEQDNMLRDKDYGSMRSTTKHNDVNPVWDEEFQFTIPTLENMELSLQLYDDDVGGRDDKCGKCKINLEKEEIDSSPKEIERTVDRNLLRANGKIHLEISYEE
mmetsp:Transcript_23676/g.26364  ORF Transcript_23676/g.26364 Transcript_23676/m.26364 type:complete len:133 (+) Transcript_23676:112-510(+)